MKGRIRHLVRYLLLILPIVAGCASPGTPDGGPYDETPPHVVGSSPRAGATNTKKNKIEISFDEFIRVDNASEKVVVSPPQLQMPEITASGKVIKVNRLDTLRKNTTYTIDFTDAIVDNNEGNPLGNYSFVFSTGDTVDSMEVAGRVLNARDLEPVKGILVGLQSDTTDTAFLKKPFLRVARTNGSGDFIIKGVAQGTYRVFALGDADGNFCYSQKSEPLAFLPGVVKTSCFQDLRQDTVWRDSTHIDSIRMVPFTHYLPDHLVLLSFAESTYDRHLLKTERNSPEHFDVYFTAPSREEPKLKGLNFDERNAYVVNKTVGNDTLSYWLRDTTLIHRDTLEAAYTYLETDSTGQLVTRTDTLQFISKIPRAKQLKWQEEAHRKWQKEQDKLKRKGLPYETVPSLPKLEMAYKGSAVLDLGSNLEFDAKEPLKMVDTTKIHLLIKKDTTLVPAPFKMRRQGQGLMTYVLYGDWRPMQEYHFTADSAAFTGLYDHLSKRIEFTFNVPSLDTYSSFFANLIGVTDSTAIVQLLNGTDHPVYTARSKKGRADFFFVRPGTYYLRLFIDRNGNGQWDTGNYEKGEQPEEVYYYPRSLMLRARWDVSQDWDIHQRPLDKQKPQEITKQKPDKEKTIRKRNEERERNKH